MSIMLCDNCERPIDTDEQEMEEVNGSFFCITCYMDAIENSPDDETMDRLAWSKGVGEHS